MRINQRKNILFKLIIFLIVSCGKHNINVEDKTRPPSKKTNKSLSIQVSSTFIGGRFSNPPSFSVSAQTSDNSTTPEILYCINAGVSDLQNCCNPETEGKSFKGTSLSTTAGSVDGSYCLSYMGKLDGKYSEAKSVLFEIDSSIPQIDITSAKQEVQSTQYLDISFDSTDLGKSGIFFSALNYSQIQGNNCELINSESNFTNHGIDFNKDNTPDTIDMSSENQSFSQTIKGSDLKIYGNNFIYFALVDSIPDPMRTACPGIQISLKDFNVFEFSTNGDVATNSQGELEAMGSFHSFGSGSFSADTGTTKLQIGILNIIH